MAFFKKFTGGYDELWKAIIRPPRDTYDLSDLGPTEFYIGNKSYKRSDLKLTNSRGISLECSHFEPIDEERVADQLPCVIYLHGNCSSRVEALTAVPVLLPCNISVFCLDLSGCGRSGGEYISLGWYERDDVALVVDYLRSSNRVTCIGLWGRSMGAVTSLLHGDRDPSIAAMVLDSPFSSLRTLAEELTRNYVKIPKLILSGAISLIRKTVKSKAGFDINDLNPLDHVTQCFIPSLFVAGNEDTFIQPHHARELYERYAGDKNISIVDGDHNSIRPKFLLDSIAIFFYNTLMCDLLPKTKPRKSKRKEGAEFDPAEHANKHAMEFSSYLMQEEEEMIRRAIEESLMESQVELKEDEYVDLYEDKSEEHRDKPEPDDPEME
jgi:pimeloyl-ACP methyl ester carboxylesterase